MDIFDILLLHIRESQDLPPERRFGGSSDDAELDAWDLIGVARQETAMLRETLVTQIAAAKHDEEAKKLDENWRSMMSLKCTCVALAYFETPRHETDKFDQGPTIYEFLYHGIRQLLGESMIETQYQMSIVREDRMLFWNQVEKAQMPVLWHERMNRRALLQNPEKSEK